MKNEQSFEIEGLGGEKKLRGTIIINGAKNAALKAMASSVLFSGQVILQNIPNTDDINKMAEILRKLGAVVDKTGESEITIDASQIKSKEIDASLAKSMRASVVLTGPILSRFGKVSFPLPGGCVIGARPIDLFIDGYSKMGAITTEERYTYKIQAKNKLSGANIIFNKVSVGATETLMMASVMAKGTTVLENCAMEPEIGNVAEWLNSCGANISGYGTPQITIQGTDGKLLNPNKPYVAIPDRIEAGSYLFLGALLAENITIKNCRPDHMESVIGLLRDSGVVIKTDTNNIYLTNNTKPNSSFKSFNVKTHEYPGFPTDLQAQAVTFLTQTEGESTVQETIFEGRFKYVADLVKMGASITEMNPHEILVKGPTTLRELSQEEDLSAHDIRAGFAIVMATLIGKGKFRINNIHLIDRGYEGLEVRLQNIGANIVRV